MAATGPRILIQTIQGTEARDGSNIAAGIFNGPINFTSQSAAPSESRKCLNALFLTDPEVDREDLISAKGGRVPGTCEWVVKSEAYLEWRSGVSRLLWIRGGPGKGKTMLSIFLTQEIGRRTSGDEDTQTAYYFCLNRDEKHNNAAAVLRGLLWQLVKKDSRLAEKIAEYFATPEMIKTSLSSRETLWIMLKKILQNAECLPIFFLLDGLDECDDDSIRWLTEKLVWLSLSPNQPRAGFNLIVVSRDVPGLSECAQLRLDPDNDQQVKSDIETFIKAKVEALSKEISLELGYTQTLEKELLARAQGTFLWVGYAMVELVKKKTSLEVDATLRALPTGLDAIYDRMLAQIPSDYRDRCSRLLTWVTLAMRPLSVPELSFALQSKETSSHASDEAAEHTVWDLIKLCGPLLQKQHNDSIALVHQSAKDFLLRSRTETPGSLDWLRIAPKPGHLHIAEVCLNRMRNSTLSQSPLAGPNTTEVDRDALRDRVLDGLTSEPLLFYSVYGWVRHLDAAAELTQGFINQNRWFFDSDSRMRQLWWQSYSPYWSAKTDVYHKGRRFVPPSTLHQSSGTNCLSWARTILSSRVNRLRWRTGQRLLNQDTSLHIAAARGYYDMARLLVDEGASINLRDSYHSTPLHCAVLSRSYDTARLLIDNGAKVNARAGSHRPWGSTPLERAAYVGDCKFAQLLIENGAQVNTTGRSSRMRLYSTADADDGHCVLVNLLINVGIRLSRTYFMHRTALHAAALNNHCEVAQLLINNDAVVNSVDWIKDTPLHDAARNGHCDVARLLIDNGATVNSINCGEETPLFRAAESGHCDVAQLLIDNGAVVNQVDGDKRTPLSVAAEEGHYNIAQLLINNGASVNQADDYNRTPLFRAAEKGHYDIAQLLINSGAVIDQKDEDGTSTLSVAVRNNHMPIAHLLVDNGAQVDRSNEHEIKALEYSERLNGTRLDQEGAAVDGSNVQGPSGHAGMG